MDGRVWVCVWVWVGGWERNAKHIIHNYNYYSIHHTTAITQYLITQHSITQYTIMTTFHVHPTSHPHPPPPHTNNTPCQEQQCPPVLHILKHLTPVHCCIKTCRQHTHQRGPPCALLSALHADILGEGDPSHGCAVPTVPAIVVFGEEGGA